MIRMSDVSMVYENGTRAVKKATLRIDEGEFVFLVGASGSGKSTLIKLLTGEVRPTTGRIVVNNYNIGTLKKREVPYLRRTLGVVFQDFRLIEKKTVYENVAFAMRAIGARSRVIRKRVPYVLDLVGLTEKMDTRPLELSGGEQQRVAIARALVNNPRLLIADEPTGNLDPARSLELMTLFEKINELGTTILIVTHEKELVDKFEKRVISINNGVIVSDQTGGYYGAEEDEAEELPEPEAPSNMFSMFGRFGFGTRTAPEPKPQTYERGYDEEEMNQAEMAATTDAESGVVSQEVTLEEPPVSEPAEEPVVHMPPIPRELSAVSSMTGPIPSLHQTAPIPNLHQTAPIPNLHQTAPIPNVQEAAAAASAAEELPAAAAAEAGPPAGAPEAAAPAVEAPADQAQMPAAPEAETAPEPEPEPEMDLEALTALIERFESRSSRNLVMDSQLTRSNEDEKPNQENTDA